MQTHLLEYMQVFFRRKFIFLYAFIAVFSLMVMVSLILPKTYEAATAILITEARDSNPLVSDLAKSAPLEARMYTMRELILGFTTLSELVTRLKLDKDVKSAAGYEALINTLRKNILVFSEVPQVVRISYVGNDPFQVYEIAKNLGEVFVQQNVKLQNKEADLALNFLDEQLRYYRRKIRQDEVKRLQEELARLRLNSTEQHPLVKDFNNRIAVLTEALKTDDEHLGPEFSGALPAPTKEEALLTNLMLNEIEGKEAAAVSGISSAGQKTPGTLPAGMEASVQFDADVNRVVYLRLMERLETARITQKLNAFQQGSRFTIIEPARLPSTPVKPNKTQLYLLGLVLGIAAGVGCIRLAENFDTSFHTLQQAKAVLPLLVLGMIPLIITEDEYARKLTSARFSYLIVMALVLLIFGIAVVAAFIG